jgi:anti-sigma-K factor RskA
MAAKKRGELLNLIPAYAIGALDEDERADFEAWLQHDPEAQTLLADYQAVAAHLVVLAPLRAAPDHLQADLHQRLAASQGGEAVAQPVEKKPVVLQRPSRRRFAWGLAAAALLAVLIAAVLITQLNLTDDSNPPLDAAQLYAQLVAQPDANQYAIVPGEVDNAVSGNLIVSSDGIQAVLHVTYLPPLASDQTFQMWLVDSDGARTSAGLFQADTAQEALYIHVPFDRPVTAYNGVGVSLEPAGGSPYVDQPTGPRVLSVPLNQ